MSGTTDEEKLAIANHYLMSSPPAEVREVLADIKTVLNPPTLLTDGLLKGTFRKYNTKHFEVFDAEGSPVLVSEFGEIDSKHYHDGHGQVFEVDHVAQKATKATDGTAAPSGPNESVRSAIQKAMDEYCSTQFSDNSATAACYDTGKDIVVLISASKANLRNFWSGKWRSEWHIDPKGKTASGKVNIVVHYFEDGNVQLDQNKDIDKQGLTAKGSDDQSFAEAVKSFISKNEADIQDTLEGMYQNMSVETFKDMRRILPISKTKMDWTGAQMKLAGTMGKTKG